ncbi:MAG: hypothetical protein ACI8Z5_001403 [Lentimonas sp.]|jgi:hypothetical protein
MCLTSVTLRRRASFTKRDEDCAARFAGLPVSVLSIALISSLREARSPMIDTNRGVAFRVKAVLSCGHELEPSPRV